MAKMLDQTILPQITTTKGVVVNVLQYRTNQGTTYFKVYNNKLKIDLELDSTEFDQWKKDNTTQGA